MTHHILSGVKARREWTDTLPLSHAILRARYGAEERDLKHLRSRLASAPATFREEWLPRAKEAHEESESGELGAESGNLDAGSGEQLATSSGDGMPEEAMPTTSHDDAARVYYTFRAELVERLEEVPRWMLLRYLSTAEPTGHNREEGEALRSRVADAMKVTRQGERELAAAGDGAAEATPDLATGGA